jgi:toxin ParE1/3/4
VKVRWTDEARNHLDRIYDYIAQDSPTYALRMVDRITRRSEQIAAFPRSGRVVPEVLDPELREVIEGPYRIVYRILAGGVDIVSILHSSRLADLGEDPN